MADLLHRLRRWFWRLRNPMSRVQSLRDDGRCLDCGAPLTAGERTYYETNCNRCEAFSPYAKPEPPICTETREPKWPGNCWNVRCQLGRACCRNQGGKAND